ncbi:MAG: tripartite tricarboxylate transporter TctB family protein [Smithellaceae bacterium]|nr:tripartite tricarboxylate transporter TctB family protein [Smithellaceae bacterium]
MRKGDRIFGVICLGLSLWLILEANRFDYIVRYTPGPGFLPFWLGISLGLLSLYLIVKTFLRKNSKDYDTGRLPGRKSLHRVGFILLFLAGFTFFMTTLGFTLTVLFTVALMLLLLENYSIWKSMMYGLMFSGFTFLIFRYWLEVDLPKGLVGF